LDDSNNVLLHVTQVTVHSH